MTCKYPVNSRSYKFCLGCSDIDCCEDAVTPIILQYQLEINEVKEILK